METWAIVTLVLGTSALSSLLTFLITKMQVSHSDKRLEEELERAREMYQRERRREVRGEPLLKLRNELAVMAAKQDRLTAASSAYLDLFGTSDKEEIREKGKELRDARDNWNIYSTSGFLKGILFLQSDEGVINEVEEILEDYNRAYIFFENYWDTDEVLTDDSWELKEAELRKYRNVFEGNRNKIPEVQEAINKRLEKLWPVKRGVLEGQRGWGYLIRNGGKFEGALRFFALLRMTGGDEIASALCASQ